MVVEVSSSLIFHARQMVDECFDDSRENRNNIQGTNGFSFHANPVYFSAVAAIEAFINEVFLSEESQNIMPAAPLWHIDSHDLDFLELKKKLLLVPALLFGKPLLKNEQPYQDMQLLIKVRNYLAHYKVRNEPPSFFNDLIQRNIVLHDMGQFSFSPVLRLGCTHGVFWAYNTVCKTALRLLTLATEEYQREEYSKWFEILPDDYFANRSKATG